MTQDQQDLLDLARVRLRRTGDDGPMRAVVFAAVDLPGDRPTAGDLYKVLEALEAEQHGLSPFVESLKDVKPAKLTGDGIKVTTLNPFISKS